MKNEVKELIPEVVVIAFIIFLVSLMFLVMNTFAKKSFHDSLDSNLIDINTASNITPWCVDLVAEMDNASHNFKGCAETKAICLKVKSKIEASSGLIGVSSVGKCYKEE